LVRNILLTAYSIKFIILKTKIKSIHGGDFIFKHVRLSYIAGNLSNFRNAGACVTLSRLLLLFFIIMGFLIPEVVAASNSPVLSVIGDRSVNENSQLTFTLSATDSNNDSLAFSASNLPSGAVLNNSTGVFRWTPTFDQAGEYLVQFVVTDGSHLDSEYITITVKNTNRAPFFSAINDSSTNECEEIKLTLKATDEDSDILAFSKDVSFGTLDGNIFSWTPGYDDQGDHEIVFSVNDGSSLATQTALITVSNVNRAPVLYSVSDVSVPDENTPITIQLESFDADGDQLNYSATSLPAGSSFDSETGLFQWSNPGSGTYDLIFSVSDGYSSSNTKYPQIVVSDTNSPPEFNSVVSQSVNESSELSFEIAALDSDSNEIYITQSSILSGSSFTTSDSSATFTWTPTYDQAGIHEVEFRVSETDTVHRLATYEVVDITVNDVNRAPVIDAVDDYTVSENGLLYVNLNATDPDGDTLTYSTDSSLGIVRGNTFICTPDYSDEGVYDVQYTASDGNLENSTMATITVIDSNMPPKLNSISAQKVAVNDTLNFSLSVSDDDGESFYYKALDLPSGAVFDESEGIFEWTPSSEDVGDYSVSFYVSDSSHEDYETVSITVTEPSSSSSGTTSSSGSSGGGGGGSQNTGEEFENIEFKDYALKYVMKDEETVFEFDEPANDIVSISFVCKRNGGQTKALIEVLKGTSSLVNSAPSGKVYRNLNIWVGDSKFPSDVIDDGVIRFKVEKSWVNSNDLEPDSIVLSRYSDGKWALLETSFESEEGDYLHYTAESPGFSPFAILVPEVTETILSKNSSAENTTVMSMGDEIVPVGKEVTPDKKSSKGILLFLVAGIMIAVVAIAGYRYRGHYEELYLQISNPDGKRYRRLKK
jgi:PGF-pre-PGF domain-containing protein